MKPRLLIASLLFGLASAALAQEAPEPDQSKFHLGPTGMSGTLGKNAITVIKVEKGSPAEGKIKVGDQIVGAGGKAFAKDVRRELADAIDAAETEAAGGKLTLLLKGNQPVELQLKVLGTYSPTAPYDCPKTDAIVRQTAEHLLTAKDAGEGACVTGILGLMATGEPKYIEAAGKLIKQADWSKTDGKPFEKLLTGEEDAGLLTWRWGYQLIALCEYYALTKDESVLPAIRSYAVTLARGQDAGGLWGHRLATVSRFGRLPGYAQMNQPSITCFMGMLLAKKIGIDDPALDRGIARTYSYYATYIGEGSLNYGVHGPNTQRFNNNGTSGSLAVCMSIHGNKEGARFFSQLAAAAHEDLESGHASTFFNPLWTPLGAALSGPEVTHQFFARSRWHQTIYRSWNGGFDRFGGGQKEGPQAGSALLAYCLPRQALYITGKDADESIWLAGDDATRAVEASEIDFKRKTADELIALLDHPMPPVRRNAAWVLRDHEPTFVPKLVQMMRTGTDLQKRGALAYFGYGCPPAISAPHLDEIGAILRDKSQSPRVRAAAASTLSAMGEPAQKYYVDMLQLVVDDEPGDIFGDTDESVSKSINDLCKDPYAAGLVAKNEDLFYQAAMKLTDHKRQNVRSEGMQMLASIPLDKFPLVADRVIHIIEDKDPTYHSYHAPQSAIGSAIAILANLNIREGIDYTMSVLEVETGKWGFKVRMVCDALPKYGANAKEALEKLKADKRFKDIEQGRFKGMWQKMVTTIENDKEPKMLISLEEAKKGGSAN